MKTHSYPLTVNTLHFVPTRLLVIRAARDCCPNSYTLLIERCRGDVNLADELVAHWREAHRARQAALLLPLKGGAQAIDFRAS